MDKLPPSIFNDVIGPVMRGPSSSHTAASVRIGRIIRQLLGEKPVRALFEFDPNGSLASTYESQGSAIGLAAGLLGWEITHPELENSLKRAKEGGIDISFQIKPFTATHPNTYKITVEGVNDRKLNLIAISSGGGMIDINSIDGIKLSLKGDFFESLLLFETISKDEKEKLKSDLKINFPNAIILFFENGANTLLNLKTGESVYNSVQEFVPKHLKIGWSCEVEPVMPIISQKSYDLPFSSYEEMLLYARDEKTSLADLAIEYESARAGISKAEVFEKMKKLVQITQQGIKEGLSGTHYKDRILGQQSHLILKAENENKLIQSSINNRIIAYTSALMEVKSSMGVIVAAPTAGSCAVLGGAVFAASDKLDGDLENTTRAFLSAGLIGVFIARDYTFAAEEGGCQVECGAASGMAAAGLVEMMGGNYKTALMAASMALQNLIGLVCDPVADRVEVPCLGKNILGATNAMNSANMSLAGFEEVIPLDQVIEAMKIVGNEMPSSICCTGLSGLSVTDCSKKIKQELKEKNGV